MGFFKGVILSYLGGTHIPYAPHPKSMYAFAVIVDVPFAPKNSSVTNVNLLLCELPTVTDNKQNVKITTPNIRKHIFSINRQ
jgi:hypothetical protein